MMLGSISMVLMGESGIDEHGDNATVPSLKYSGLDIVPPLLIVSGSVNEKVVLSRSEETRLLGALDKDADGLFALLSEIGGGELSIMSMRHFSTELGENGERLVLLHAEVAFKLESRIGSLYPSGGGDAFFLR